MRDRILFKSELFEVGEFTIKPDDAKFSDQGRIDAPLLVFPKTSIWIHHDGSKPFVSDPTRVNLYNKGQIYQRSAISHTGDVCHWFRLDDALLSDMLRTESNHFKNENMACPAAVFITHLQLLECINHKAGLNVMAVEAQLVDMFRQLLAVEAFSDCTFNQIRYKHQRLVEQVKATLNEDLSAQMSLQKLAAMHHTSPFHLSRVFKAINGEGISQYRKRQRLHQLSLDLQSRPDNLIDLAFTYGFSSHSHMSACYKSTFGLTPSQTRSKIYSQ